MNIQNLCYFVLVNIKKRPESVTSREDYREHYRERGEVEQDPGNVMDVLVSLQNVMLNACITVMSHVKNCLFFLLLFQY